MESNTEFVYKALSPLAFSTDEPEPEPDGDPFESYTVFRNTITLSAGPMAEISVAEYLSLDVSADETPSHDISNTPIACARVANGNHAAESAWFRAGRRFRSPMLQLHKEILDFCAFISPTLEEQSSRSAAVESVFGVIKYIWPHCRVEVFGSYRTGLYLPTSDIDVVILESKVRTPQMGLFALSRALSQKSIAKNVQVIAKARVPIIKFVEKQSGIAFDISFDVDNGPKAAIFIKDAVDKIPPLRPLCLILKVFLQQRELNEVYSGGIGSYALLAMLIAFLQVHKREQVFQGSQNTMEHNLGILLANFFEFYGRKLNIMDVGVSCNLRGTFFLKSDKGFYNKERPHLLSIEDPQAPDNDVGKNSYNFFKVRSAFVMASSSLTDSKAITALGPDRSLLGTIIRPDPVLLDRKGGCHGELTFNNLLPGADKPVLQLLGGEGDFLCNWQFLDDEPLPRDRKLPYDGNNSSPRERKSSKIKHKSHKRGDIEISESRKVRNAVGSEKKVKRRKKGFDDWGFDRSLPCYFSRNH